MRKNFKNIADENVMDSKWIFQVWDASKLGGGCVFL